MLDKKLLEISRKILSGMKKEDFDKIKSITGLIETSCNIVEEAYKRLDQSSKSIEKKNTAIILMRPVFQKLKEEQIIDNNIEKVILDQLNNGHVDSLIDDVILSWKKRFKKVKRCCFYFKKGSEFVTNLEKIIVDMNSDEGKNFFEVEL